MIETIKETPDYRIDAELLEVGISIHGEVFGTWSKTLRNEIKNDIQTLATSANPCPVVAFHAPRLGRTQRHFLKIMGGVYDGEREVGGEQVEVFKFLP